MSAEPTGFVSEDRVGEIRAYVESGKSWPWTITRVAFGDLFAKLDAKNFAIVRQAEALSKDIDEVSAMVRSRNAEIERLKGLARELYAQLWYRHADPRKPDNHCTKDADCDYCNALAMAHEFGDQDENGRPKR